MVSEIKALCKSANITIKYLECQLGFGNGTIRRWDAHTPSYEKITKVADYFGVTVDELTGIKKEPTATNDDELSAEFIKLFTQLSPAERERELAYLRERVAAQDK